MRCRGEMGPEGKKPIEDTLLSELLLWAMVDASPEDC